MTEHLKTEDLQRYRERKLSPLELLAADDHLAVCDGCRASLGPNAVSGLAEAIAGDDFGHLSYESFRKIADGTADDVETEIAGVHLRSCDACADDLAAMIAVRDEIAGAPGEEPSKPSWTDRFRQLWAVGWPVFAGAAAIVLAVALFVWVAGRRSESEFIALTNSNSGPDVPVENANSAVTPEASPQSDTNTDPTASPFDDRFGNLPPAIKAEVERAVASGKLTVPDSRELAGRTGQLMGGGSGSVPFALIGPVGKVVESNRPTLSWRAFPGAESYQVEIYDMNFNHVVTGPRSARTDWQPDSPLRRGRTYVWQVTAFKDGKEVKSPVRPAPDAKFRVIDARQADDIATLRRRSPNEHLALGIIYARAGLLVEAAAEFRKELARNPNSREARRFLSELARIR